MNTDINESFSKLISILNLKEIRPISLSSERKGDIQKSPPGLVLSWGQAIAEEDPVKVGDDTIFFRTKFDFSMKQNEAEMFHHVSIFIVVFGVSDCQEFFSFWAQEDIRKIFLEKQLQRTLWPIVRQQVLDGMCRLGIVPVITLPWLH